MGCQCDRCKHTATRCFNSACSINWDAQNYFVSPFFAGNPVYDGRITFARIKYQGSCECECECECGREGSGWAHDYPLTETHFMRILRELTSIRPFVESGPIAGNILIRFDQPEIFEYTVAYLSEPGGLNLTDAEMRGFKQYIDVTALA